MIMSAPPSVRLWRIYRIIPSAILVFFFFSPFVFIRRDIYWRVGFACNDIIACSNEAVIGRLISDRAAVLLGSHWTRARVNTQNHLNDGDLQVKALPGQFPLQFGGVNVAGDHISHTHTRWSPAGLQLLGWVLRIFPLFIS